MSQSYQEIPRNRLEGFRSSLKHFFHSSRPFEHETEGCVG
jgi:hypothetical protein